MPPQLETRKVCSRIRRDEKKNTRHGLASTKISHCRDEVKRDAARDRAATHG